ELGRALAAEALDRPVMRPRGDAQALGAVQRRDLDLGAPDRLRDRERDLDLDVVALALEHLVVLHVRDDVQVARRAAVAPWLTLAGEADARALAHAGRDVHPVALRGAHGAFALAGLAGVLDHGPGAAAAAAGMGDREQPLARRLEAAALTARADLRRCAGLRAGALAGRA